MSFNVITNRTVKAFVQAKDFYPGFELEEEYFSKAIIKDVDQNKSRFKKKSDGLIGWTAGDYNQLPPPSATAAKNTYQ
jgi:hypothetical protein